jgi:hypothetical protein
MCPSLESHKSVPLFIFINTFIGKAHYELKHIYISIQSCIFGLYLSTSIDQDHSRSLIRIEVITNIKAFNQFKKNIYIYRVTFNINFTAIGNMEFKYMLYAWKGLVWVSLDN